MKFTEKQKQTIHKIYTTLKKAGFDDISIAGMLGNALSESSFNPDSISKSNYHGLWQNNNDLHNAVIGTYGNHNIDTLLRYVIDWTNAHKTVTKGKHRDWLATGAGKFKKTGYKNAKEASDAFMKLYERPVILDKKGNIIGYLKDTERRSNSSLMYDYINSQYNGNPVVSINASGDGNKKMNVSYPKVDWTQSEIHLPAGEFKAAKPISTDYTPVRDVPEQYDALNGAGSPTYGGYTPRLQDVQEVNSRINHDILNMIDIEPTINKFLIPFAPKYNKGKNATKKSLPRFDEGTPTTVGPYNVYPSALRPTNTNIPYVVTTPEINVYGLDKRPLYQRYDALNSTYDPNAIRNITDLVPGIGDVSLGLDAVNAFKNQDYMQAGMLGALMFAPNALEPIAKPILRNLSKYAKPAGSAITNAVKKIPGMDAAMNAISKRWDPELFDFFDNGVPDYYGQNFDKYPEAIQKSLENSVYPRMRKMRPWMTDELFKGAFDYAADGKYTVYPARTFKKAYGEDSNWAGLYFPDTDHIAIQEGKTFDALGHESRHKIDEAIPRTELEDKYLSDAYDDDFLSLEEFKDSDMNAERPTVNYDSRRELLGWDADKYMPVDELNKMIDAASDAEIFAAVENSNGYGKAYIEAKRKAKKLTPEFARKIRTSMKKVGVAAAPIIPAGTALYMGAKDFKQEDLNNAINNLKVLAEGVGYNSGKDIYIKPSKRGTFTAAAKKHNKSVLAFANQVLSNPGKYSKAMRKKALFVKNSKSWNKK